MPPSSAAFTLAGNTATNVTAASSPPSLRVRGTATSTAAPSSTTPLPSTQARADPSGRGTIGS
jgi:hypothetical protein